MATRTLARTAVAAAAGMLLTTTSSGAAAVAAPAAQRDAAGVVIASYQARIPKVITLRMLLSHTAGFTHEAPLGNNYEPEPGDFDSHVRSISDTWLRFPVGTGYAYSNLGIDLAGYILERI